LVIDPARPIGEQLRRQLRSLIRSGSLLAGAQLPPTRLLAVQLGLARKTVADVYESLVHEQLLEARQGRGSFVRAMPQGGLTHEPSRPGAPLASAPRVAAMRDLAAPFLRVVDNPLARFDFVGGSPDPALFPTEDWRRHLLAAQRQIGANGAYTTPAGSVALREAIAEHVAYARGVRCTAADVIVTQGAQQAFDLLARLLIAPGEVAAVESPGYPPMVALLKAQGARVVATPVDDEGLQVEQLPGDARLAYTTPAHQFPLGMAMSTARRLALLAWADRQGAVVIEDDYDSEFRFEGRPQDSLQGLDRTGRIAFVGSFSKTLSPALRIGYLIAPPALREALLTLKHVSDWHGPTLLHGALAGFMHDGSYRRHLRRSQSVYGERRQRLLAGLAGPLAPWLEGVPTEAGFHLAARLRPDCKVDSARLASFARRVEVGLYPLASFGPAPEGLLMGFGRISASDMDTAVQRLAELLATLQ
jgi:GntR family transcriptional regulator / MocR family aminotransferase